MSQSILGQSEAVSELIQMIHRVAGSKTNILIVGESGTGKELTARMIHDLGPLSKAPFVPVNCGAIPESLIETELFGHHKGSFTGAISEKAGLFEAASRGTLFLDEIGELSLSMQVKLLRVLQEKNFRKVGGLEDIRADVRIIAATNRNLEAAVGKGIFREDLYYRLNVIQIRTPPLRDRTGDVKILAENFLRRYSERAGKRIQGFEPPALKAIEAYHWPGNVRELQNCVERAVTLETNSMVGFGSLPQMVKNAVDSPGDKGSSRAEGGPGANILLPSPDFSKKSIDLEKVLGEVEKVYVLAAIRYSQGSKKRAAELLGVNLRGLRYRLKKFGISE